jgi:hypothetical protein
MMKPPRTKPLFPPPGHLTITLILSLALLWHWNSAVFASEPCETGGNVIPKAVCDFDSFYGSPPRQLPNGWAPFILYGDLTYMQDVDTYWGAPALRMWNNGGTFKAGIYTQVQVTPGAGYRASVAWAAPNAPDHFGRQLGLDPTGGTDPNSPNVIWGPMHWGPGRMLNYPEGPNIDVRARATGGTMTVFFLVDHPTSTGDNLIFVDAISLYPDENAPALAPTPTSIPTDTPTAVVQRVAILPTATWTPVPSATPTETPLPTETPTPTVTPSPTPSPTFTPSPTWTPWPTVTPDAAIQAGSPGGEGALLTVAAGMAHQSGRSTLLLVGVIGIGGAGLCGSSLWWLRRRRI